MVLKIGMATNDSIRLQRQKKTKKTADRYEIWHRWEPKEEAVGDTSMPPSLQEPPTETVYIDC